MSGDSPAPARIVIDHELLWRLGPDTPPEEWERTLRRSGLCALAPGESEQGRLVRELVRTVEGWPRAVPDAAPPSFLPHSPLQWLGLGAAAVALFGLMASAFMVGLALLTVLLGTGAILVITQDSGVRRRLLASVGGAEGKKATRVLRHLLGRTFVDVAGETIVENLPHRDYLVLRLGEVERAITASEARSAEICATLDGIRVSNARLGRGTEDAETANLEDAERIERGMRERVAVVRDELRQRLVGFDAELDRLRILAERRALSERVSRLTDAGVGEDALRAAAAIEVDVAGIEKQLSALKLGALEEDARLRAVLEVVGAQRR